MVQSVSVGAATETSQNLGSKYVNRDSHKELDHSAEGEECSQWTVLQTSPALVALPDSSISPDNWDRIRAIDCVWKRYHYSTILCVNDFKAGKYMQIWALNRYKWWEKTSVSLYEP